MAAKQVVERLVVNTAVRIVDVAALNVDYAYQREVKPKHAKIAAEFNEDAFGVPLVAERADGSLWIVDGLQRISAARLLKWREVRVKVFASDGLQHEAEVYRIVNIDRTRLTVQEEFRSMLVSGDEDAIAVKKVVESCGFKLKLQGGKQARGSMANEDDSFYNLTCIGTLLNVHRKIGDEAIVWVLNTVEKSWPGDRQAVNNKMVEGMAIYWERTEGNTQDEKLIPRLQTVTPHKVLYLANQGAIGGGKGLSKAVADVIERVLRKRLTR